MAAPGIRLAAHIAAAEHRMIVLTLRKQLGNLQFAQRSQETEILHVAIQILGHILSEITLKFDGLAVLVVDVRAGHGGLVRAVFVR